MLRYGQSSDSHQLLSFYIGRIDNTRYIIGTRTLSFFFLAFFESFGNNFVITGDHSGRLYVLHLATSNDKVIEVLRASPNC